MHPRLVVLTPLLIIGLIYSVIDLRYALAVETKELTISGCESKRRELSRTCVATWRAEPGERGQAAFVSLLPTNDGTITGVVSYNQASDTIWRWLLWPVTVPVLGFVAIAGLLRIGRTDEPPPDHAA